MPIKTIIKLHISAQSAVMGPPLGPTLGQFGVSAVEFINKFNNLSSSYIKGTILSTVVTVYVNRSFDIVITGPNLSFLLKSYYKLKNLNSSLYLYSGNNLLITKYMLFEIYFFLKEFSSFYKENIYLITNKFVKSIRGFVKSLSILYIA